MTALVRQNITPITAHTDAQGFDSRQMTLLRDTICKGATPDEFQMFAHVCKKTGLDPFMKQVFPVKRWDAKLKREVMTIQTSIDGYRLIADRTGRYAPGREPTFATKPDGSILSATSYVKKQTADGTWHEVAATAFYDEYCQKFADRSSGELKATKFWADMPHSQTAKCAEALALRKAFPAEMSGIYTKDEMQQSEAVEVPSVPVSAAALDRPTKQEEDDLQAFIAGCSADFQENVRFHMGEKKMPAWGVMSRGFFNALRTKAEADFEAFSIKDAIVSEESSPSVFDE